MDTVSSPDSHHVPIVRASLSLIVLVFVALALLGVAGVLLDAIAPPIPDDPLLGPFRWTYQRTMA